MTATVYNVAIILALAAAWIAGLHELVHDETGLVWVIAAIAIVGGVSARLARPWLRWLCDEGIAMLVGLFGTVVGFMLAIEGMVSGEEAEVMRYVATALSTTAVGLVAHGYLILLRRLTRDSGSAQDHRVGSGHSGATEGGRAHLRTVDARPEGGS